MKNNYLFIGILIVLSVVLMSFNQTKVDKGYVVEANPKFKNLKVLPKDISEEGLDAVMDSFNEALGVKCSHCHARGENGRLDFASDANIQKDIAREMMKMTSKINRKYFKEKDPMNYAVTCYTCHNGEAVPSKSAPTE